MDYQSKVLPCSLFFCLKEHLLEKASVLQSHSCSQHVPMTHKLVLHVCYCGSLNLFHAACQHLNSGPHLTAVMPHSVSINPLSIHLKRGFSILLLCSGRSFSLSSSCIDFPGSEMHNVVQ